MKNTILTKVNTTQMSYIDYIHLNATTKKVVGDFLQKFVQLCLHKCLPLEPSELYIRVMSQKSVIYRFEQFGEKIIVKTNESTQKRTFYKIS